MKIKKTKSRFSAKMMLVFISCAQFGCGSGFASQSAEKVPMNSIIATLAGTAGVTGFADATGAAASFDGPHGVATDGTNLYLADSDNNTIRKIVIATGVVTTLAGTAGVTGFADATGAAASFDGPHGVATDGTNLYVTDVNNRTIRQIVIATGVVTTLAGTAGVVGTADGTGAAAEFKGLEDIATDGTNLYVVDTFGRTIRQIVIATGVVTTLAGTVNVQGSADGTGIAASFNFPYGIATDGTNLYIADEGNNTIRKIVIATAVVTTLAGTAGVTGSADGTGAAASFNFPNGVTTDGTNLYLTDTGNGTIRKIVIGTGAVTTLAGTTGVVGSADGIGAAASFNFPNGIVIDGANLYLADAGNSTIRKIIIQ